MLQINFKHILTVFGDQERVKRQALLGMKLAINTTISNLSAYYNSKTSGIVTSFAQNTRPRVHAILSERKLRELQKRASSLGSLLVFQKVFLRKLVEFSVFYLSRTFAHN